MTETKPNTDQIRDTELEIFEMQTRNRVVVEEMNTIKSNYVNDIEAEATASKSPDLSNQTKRNAVVDTQLNSDGDYHDLLTEHNALDKDLSLMGIDLSYIKRIERQKLSDVDMLPFTALGRIADALEQLSAHKCKECDPGDNEG